MESNKTVPVKRTIQRIAKGCSEGIGDVED